MEETQTNLVHELSSLIAMKKDGMLTDEEFSAAKAVLLGLKPKKQKKAPPPNAIIISNANTQHGPWPNDIWNLAGECNGRPQWRRRGNPADYLKWDGRRWTINGMQPLDYFEHKSDAMLPPTSGWRATHHSAQGAPALEYRHEIGKVKRLVLVQKDSPNALRFPGKLSDPGTVTALRMCDGKGIQPCWSGYRDFHGYKYIELEVDPDSKKPFEASFDGECIEMKFEGMVFVFDLSFGKHHEGNTCNFVVDCDPNNTKNVRAAPGRHFVINPDGTVSPKHAQHLALGI